MKKILSLFLLALGLFWPSYAVAEMNEWTDLKGRTLKAKFIKGDPQKVTVEWNGRRFDLPLNTLAPDSRKLALKLISAAAYEARKPGGSEGMQTWTDSRGRSLLARFVRSDDVTVTLNLKGKDVDVPLASLSEKSRVQAEELRKKSSPKAPGSPSAPKLEPTSAEGLLDLSAEQIWSAPNGQAFKGRFVRATDANVTITTRTILGAERETVLPLSALSATSRTLAEKLNVLAKKAAKERAAFAKKRLRMKVPPVTEADLKKEHAWVNDANQTVRAYFVDADDAGVTVLFSNNPSRPYELPWEKISPDSQLLAEALRRKKEELEPKKPKILAAAPSRLESYGNGRWKGYNTVFQSALYDAALHYSGKTVRVWLKEPPSSRGAEDGVHASDKPISIHFHATYYDRSDPKRVRHRHRKITSFENSPPVSMDRELSSISGTLDNNATFSFDMDINHKGLSFWGRVKDPRSEKWPTRFSIAVYTANIVPDAKNATPEIWNPIVGDAAVFIDPIEERRVKLSYLEKWDVHLKKYAGGKWNPVKAVEFMGKPYGSHKVRVAPAIITDMNFRWGRGYSGVFPFQGVHLGFNSAKPEDIGIISKNRRLSVYVTKGKK